MDVLQSFPFGVERHYKGITMSLWAQRHWTESFYIVAVYLVLVHWGQRMMKQRERFVLRKPLFLWNVGLAVFSIIGFCKMFPGIVVDLLRCVSRGTRERLAPPPYRPYTINLKLFFLRRYGWQYSFCSLEWLNGPSGVWALLFGLSKPVELFDTLFIVLRKQKLGFLHWYHHATVCCFAWFTFTRIYGPARLFAAFNFFVHSLMYTYYAVRAQGLVRIPRAVSISLTSLQIAQMVFAVGGYLVVYALHRSGVMCNADSDIITVGFAMYLSYGVLFCHFFYVNYMKGGG
jgi:elongation of very long chain fatty acids protein 6